MAAKMARAVAEWEMTKTDSGLRIAETKETSSQDGQDMEQVGEEARAAQVNAVRAHTHRILRTRSIQLNVQHGKSAER